MKSILIVDDEAPARSELRYLLRDRRDARVTAEAATLAEARAALAQGPVDLVFLDVNLLGENGFDLLPDLPAGTQVVFVTAHAKFAPRAREAKVLGYLLKPLAPGQLDEVFEKLAAA